jgi:hypothetical protein
MKTSGWTFHIIHEHFLTLPIKITTNPSLRFTKPVDKALLNKVSNEMFLGDVGVFLIKRAVAVITAKRYTYVPI